MQILISERSGNSRYIEVVNRNGNTLWSKAIHDSDTVGLSVNARQTAKKNKRFGQSMAIDVTEVRAEPELHAAYVSGEKEEHWKQAP